MRLVATLLFLAVRALPNGGALEVTATPRRVTVGDPVTVTVRVQLPNGATLVDRAPRARDALPEGVRIVSADTLVPARGGALSGVVRVVLLRPGVRQLPTLAVAYRRSGAAAVDTLVGPRLSINVASVLPPGKNPGLREIKDIERSPAAFWIQVSGTVLAAALVLALVYVAARRRARRRAAALAVAAAPPSAPPSPYEIALQRLLEVEGARWPERGETALHYALTADVLRSYLEEVHGVPALERTTGELLWALPPALSGAGLRAECGALLEEADLVKFARLRPSAQAAGVYLRRARALVERWHASGAPAPAEAEANAVR